MPEMHPLQESDSQAVERLWNSAAPFDRLNAQLLHEKVWGDADFRPELAVVSRDQQQLLGIGVAVCRPREDRITGFVKLLAVAPESQRAGIGSSIYRQLETRCHELGALEMRVAESAPNYLQPGVDERCEAALGFFAKQGYSAVGQATNMTVDLKQWESSYRSDTFGGEHPEGYNVQRATPALEAAIHQFVTRHWPPWWTEVSNALANDPVSLFVTVDAGRVIGFAAHDANNRGTGWFGPMGTCPDQQGRGIGRRLLAHCLDDMRQQGYVSATIPWVAPVEFYRKHCGAEVDRTFVRLSKQLT
ncbi:GNAT family N-acetyltransferase [Aeoliella sp.]|uniref:GNAT family N-acetyltransferase n=1 Tax=Aeoliella sp. TaxID=2795800 RepID=UPI003CCBBD27